MPDNGTEHNPVRVKTHRGNRMTWYKRCPADWQRGTRRHGMSFELRGFYSECLDVQWELQGELPKDPKTLAMLLGTNARMIRALMPQLLALGKMVETATGYHNPRMTSDITGVPIEPESSATQPPIERESSAKIQKNPMFSTRDLEIEKEEEKEREDKKAGLHVQQPMPEERPTQKVSLLNGSSATIVNDVAKWFNELSPDTTAAVECLQKLCTIYGPDAVKDGYAELAADFADNKRMGRPSYKLLQSYTKQAKDKQGRKQQRDAAPLKDFKTAKLEADRAMLEKCGFKFS